MATWAKSARIAPGAFALGAAALPRPAHAALALPDAPPQFALVLVLLLAWLIYRRATATLRARLGAEHDADIDFRRARWLTLSFVGLFALTVIANLLLSLRASENATRAQARRNALNLAQLVERRIDGVLDGVEFALELVARAPHPPAGAAPRRSPLLDGAVRNQPALAAVWVADREGRVREYGGLAPRPGTTAPVPAANPAAVRGTHYGAPVQALPGGPVPVSRALRGADGQVEGYVLGLLRLDEVEQLARELDIGRTGYVALVRGDGVPLRGSSPLARVDSRRALATLRRPGATTRADTRAGYGYRVVSGRPLGVLVRMDFSGALAAWRGTAYAYIAGSIVFLGLIAVLAFRLLGLLERQRRQQARIARLNRTHAVLSGINALVGRTRSRDELLRGACRIAVEQGAFGVAWVDDVAADGTQLRPIALAGEDATRVLCDDDGVVGLEQAGDTGVAVAQERVAASNNLARRDDDCPRKDRALALGYHSLITLPLSSGGHVVAALTLLARAPGFFDREETRLLEGLADDLSNALDHLAAQERIEYLALYDPLTGLPNRTLFLDRIAQRLARARRGRSLFAVVRLDIERFRPVNDTVGWQAGDELLQQVAQRLQAALGDYALLARSERDHFLIATGALRTEAEVASTVQDVLQRCFGESFEIAGHTLRMSARAGVALYPVDGEDAEPLMRNAEAALVRARTTADRLVFYTSAMNARMAETLAIENRLRTALERDQFVLHYQPKFDAHSGRMVGLEGLIRWNDPDSGLIPPSRFIPLLEETGLIIEVGAWVMKQAVQDYRRWCEAGFDPPRIAVNVSALQLRQDGFAASVRDALAGPAGDGHEHGLEIEITESMLMSRVETNADKLDAVRRMGVRIAIDDFGTGYSSLQYIARLPLDTLKIDRSFVTGMTRNDTDREIVASVISLAHQLRLKVVAEGVDAHDQARLLRRLECDEMQGYLFSPPLPADQLELLMQRGNVSVPQVGRLH